MSSANTIKYFFSNIILSGGLIIISVINSSAQVVIPADSSENFYISDSIFSLRSPKGYVPSLLINLNDNVKAPFQFKTKQWLLTGTTIGITTALFFVDDDIDKWAQTQKEKHNWVNKTSPAITQFGGNLGVYSLLATGLVSAAFKNEKGVRTSLLASQAVINSGIWCFFIKRLTGRERPKAAYIYSQIDEGKWNGPFGRYNNDLPYRRSPFAFDAFPSGHTATAFSIATVFASQYNDTKLVPVICYSAATAVGISRLTEHEHWASDVFAGAIMGYLAGKQVVRYSNKVHPNDVSGISGSPKNRTELSLFQQDNQIGILIRW